MIFRPRERCKKNHLIFLFLFWFAFICTGWFTHSEIPFQCLSMNQTQSGWDRSDRLGGKVGQVGSSSLGWSGRLSWPRRLGSMTFTTKTFTTECVKQNMGIPVHGLNRTFTMCPVGHSPHKIFITPGSHLVPKKIIPC